MRRDRAFTLWSSVVVLGILVGFGGGAWASNRWGCWKYANGCINWYNGATGDYWNIFHEETRADINSWSRLTTANFYPVLAAGTTDHANGYNGFYGFTGWLGLAEILRNSGCTILEGRARLNQTYLDSGAYSRTNKKHVACQEVGHLLGLDHDRGNSTSCMNDTILTQPQPSSHDVSMVNSIYPCNGTSGQWAGCRGNGCAVCAEKVALYPLYFKNHPCCGENLTCNGSYSTCNANCPAPTPADQCNGTPGQWAGCRGNGCAVCAEKLTDYPCYFRNHPWCQLNTTCNNTFFTCNANCPAPTAADQC